MKVFAASLFLATLRATVAAADSYPLNSWADANGGGQESILRIWYGDGKAYVGHAVPPEVRTAFNFTVNGARSGMLFVDVERSSSPAGTPDFPSPTFLTVNTAPGAGDPLFFSHSAVNLTAQHIYMFGGLEGFWYPTTWTDVAPGRAYLVPTSAEGTFQVRWIVDDGLARKQGATPITLATRP